MTTDRESWIVISRHFDRLCDLSPPERRREIGALELTPDQLDLLQRLLAAHDDPAGPMDEIDLGSLAHLEFGADGSRDWTDHRFGRWRAGKRIARGGMSVVYDGFRDDGQFDKRVAIKILDAGLLDSHGRERLRDENAHNALIHGQSTVLPLPGEQLNHSEHENARCVSTAPNTSVRTRRKVRALSTRSRTPLRPVRAVSFRREYLTHGRDGTWSLS